MKKRITVIMVSVALAIQLIACGTSKGDSENNIAAEISVMRTGGILTGIGQMDVLIDDEKVFCVDNDETSSVIIKMSEGTHTIQTKAQGDKSKKVKFEVSSDGDNKFNFISEVGSWGGVSLEEKNYIPE